MPTPQISQKEAKTYSISDDAKKLFQIIYKEKNKQEKVDDSTSRIRVSDLISKMAFYYEKIRNSVDYKEEHLLRKNAIDRILKRQIIIEGSVARGLNSREVSENLLYELIRASYLPNNQIPESKIDELAKLIDKYLQLKLLVLAQKSISGEEKNHFIKWIIAVMASEVEQRLCADPIDQAVVKFMYDELLGKIELPDGSPYKKDREIQIYINIHRNLLKFDQDMLSLILLNYYFADWKDPKPDTLQKMAGNIRTLYGNIMAQINHPLTSQMKRVVSRYTVYFSILTDVIKEDPVATYESIGQNNNKSFNARIKKAAAKRYSIVRTKLWRAGVRSIIYIFLTKSIFAILLEVPATQWFGEKVNGVSLTINIVFPALLLFIVILLTRLPGDDNTGKIVQGIDELVLNESKNENRYVLRPPVKRGNVMSGFFTILYSLTFVLTVGLIVWLLESIQFSWISILIFLFFLAFVSYFSIRIRKNARELIIVEPKENILSFVVDFFYIPIVSAGKWLSEKFSKINVFVFVLDFIIEAPFKVFVEIAEEWTKYVKERKDEIS